MLPNTFPQIQNQFIDGQFVVHHTRRSGSGMPMDQALEKEYNKTSKSTGGIIGFTKRKEAVAQWSIIKHEKAQFLSFLRDRCLLHQTSEYEHNIHHDFAEVSTQKNQEFVKQIVAYIVERGNPFDVKNCNISNIVTGKLFDATQADHILNCIVKGESSYQEFRNKRIIEKSKNLNDTIPKMSSKKVNPVSKRLDINKESLAALKQIDYARVRSYCVQRLLTYELADTSYFLTKDGFLRKPEKSELVREIEK